ncbi:hypothetical protein [Halomonas korlensis]|uniref:Lipoprotein n=1 Tax=Halomonas korlensis TaxID=463301 RepID=A0A1I7KLW7_9GAMM|nr:hypothetical protein [Halomonas korlensis]SFU98420.1 hypothetical protein SAMN04487955_1264 [Halomonas korlensis]
MKKNSWLCITVVSTALLSAGCAINQPAPDIKWIAQYSTDEFTDESTCRVTVGSRYTSRNIYTYTGALYPFVESKGGELRVGVMSGGKAKIPVGEVQLRIDQNPAWNIGINETPADLVPSQDIPEPYQAQLSDEQREMVASTYRATMKHTAQAMSPYTATTGEKAEAILRQMLDGNELIYRSVGLNQPGSGTGEYDLDASLNEALARCGISLP